MVHRGPEGAMVYSGLYRCSGCSVTFSDPAAWREAPADETTAVVEATSSEPAGSTYAAPSGGPSFSTWGGVLPRLGEPIGYGHSEEDLKEIAEAVARANKGKAKGRRG